MAFEKDAIPFIKVEPLTFKFELRLVEIPIPILPDEFTLIRLNPDVNKLIESGEDIHKELVLIPIEYPYELPELEFLKIILSPKFSDVPIIGNA